MAGCRNNSYSTDMGDAPDSSFDISGDRNMHSQSWGTSFQGTPSAPTTSTPMRTETKIGQDSTAGDTSDAQKEVVGKGPTPPVA